MLHRSTPPHTLSGITLVLGLACFGSGALALAPEERRPAESAPRPVSRRPDCMTCFGRKTLPCARCGGRGGLAAPCPACSGQKTTPCARKGCVRGSVTCVACKGQGRASQEVIPVRGKPYTRTIVCEHCSGRGAVDCFKCERGRNPCALCNGTGQVSGDCDLCLAGRTSCARCAGTGKGSLAALDDISEEFQEIARRASAYALEIEKRQEKLEKLRPRRDRLHAEFQELRSGLGRPGERAARYDKGPGDNVPSSADDTLPDAVRSSFERSSDALAAIDRSFRDLELLVAGKDVVLASLFSLRQEVSARLRDGREDEHTGPLAELSRFREALEPASVYVEEIDSNEETFERSQEHLERYARATRKSMEEYEKNERSREERNAQASFRRLSSAIRRKIPDLARHVSLPDPGNLNAHFDASSEPGDIWLSIRVFDQEARDERPSEELLERLPALASGLFDLAEDISRIRLAIDASRFRSFTQSGKKEIQSFSFTRSGWERLMGKTDLSDWNVVLAAGAPSPPFPEKSEADPRRIAVIVSLIAGGLIVLRFLARRIL